MRSPLDRSSERQDRPLLNEPQLRHFEVVLGQLESAIRQIEQLASPASSDEGDTLSAYERDLPEGFSSKAQPAIVAIRKEVSNLARLLHLQPHRKSRRRTIKSILTAQLVRLDDTYARKLRGYGAVNPRVEKEIDPILDSIRPALSTLLQACEAKPPRSEPTG